jgi:hypothetical protein
LEVLKKIFTWQTPFPRQLIKPQFQQWPHSSPKSLKRITLLNIQALPRLLQLLPRVVVGLLRESQQETRNPSTMGRWLQAQGISVRAWTMARSADRMPASFRRRLQQTSATTTLHQWLPAPVASLTSHRLSLSTSNRCKLIRVRWRRSSRLSKRLNNSLSSSR